MQTSFSSVLKFKQTFEELQKAKHLLGSQALTRLREESIGRLEGQGFPGKKTEEWRYTNAALLLKEDYVVAEKKAVLESESVLHELLENFDGNADKIILVNGHFSAELSSFAQQKGVGIYSLGALLSGQGPKALCEKLEKAWSHEEGNSGEAFTWLNSALCLDGCVIDIDAKISAERPIEIIQIQTGDAVQWQSAMSRNFIFMGDYSKASITEGFVGTPGSKSFSNTVSSVHLGNSAKATYIKVQIENPDSYHLSYTRARLDQSADLRCLHFGSGSRLSRQELHCEMAGREAFTRADAVYLVEGDEHMDMRTVINHRCEQGASHQLFKGIVADRSRAIFNGKIYIGEGAQQVDSSQLNKTLLLSNTAEVDAKPELEIYADDVKATHGATVGQLDEEQVFYLASRGIPVTEAETLLAQGFTGEVLDYYRDESEIVEKLNQRIVSWVKQNRSSSGVDS